jgi:deazaflavin-dependent oxidoreductase (nitroreductase family)
MQLRATNQEQSKRQVNWIGIILVNLFVAQLVFAAVKRLQEQPYDQRAINKRYLNPLMLKFAGRGTSPQAIIHHVGRKSGRSYTTPITVTPITHGFVVALPYGTDVDWCRNILAAGSGTLQWHGTTYTVIAPEIVNTESVISELPSLQRAIFRIMKVGSVLKLQLSTAPVDYASSKQ